MNDPLVSICCITYNHVSYIRQCIEGFLMQKTNFSYEIIINDDCSTDGTTEIMKEYVDKYPNLIIPIYHDENQYQKGKRGMFQKFVFPIAKGKYIAMCEGDDYWIDPMKLQKQIEFLDNNSNISYIFTGRQIYDERENTLIQQTYKKKLYYTSDILAGFNPGIQSNCFRKECIDNVDFNNYIGINGDRLIPYLCSLKGHLAAINDITAVYRKTGLGVSTRIAGNEWFKHACSDFYNFHKILGFPSKKSYLKGMVKYFRPFILKYGISKLPKQLNISYNEIININSDFNLRDFTFLLYYSLADKFKTLINLHDIINKNITNSKI